MQSSDIVTITGSEIPEEVRRLHKTPKQLHLLGNEGLLKRSPRVGIIGARKFTPYGKDVTIKITTALAREGVTIVSGMAIGIDGLVQRACLDAGGQTIAVLPSGLKSIYPVRHNDLARQIVSTNGLLVSEYDHDSKPRLYTFLERNRIIAALCDILVITEAAKASGSLNTANYALDLGIPIFAVPGNITSPYSEGTNRLIYSGATPLLSPEDLFEMLGINTEERQAYIAENEAEDAILRALKSGAQTTDDIIIYSKLAAGAIQTNLTMLEIKGVLRADAGKWFVL